MEKPKLVALIALLSLMGLGVLGVLVLRPWWQDFAPEAARLPVGLLALALGGAVFLWLRQAPRLLGVQRRRRGRLRDRYARSVPPDRDGET